MSGLDADLFRRGRDIVVFAEEILGLRLNGGQKRWYRYAAAVKPDGTWAYNRTIHVAANQIGKTLGAAVLILWACLYKIGVPLDQNWFNAPYIWFHIAPTQQQAYLALHEARELIAGSHKAQKGRSVLPQGMFVREARIANYDGLEFGPPGMISAQAQFRTTEDKAAGLQGYKAAGITFDEAAFEDHLANILNTTLMMRVAAAEGPIHLVSTPNGMNDYFDLVDAVQRLKNQPEDMAWIDTENRHAVVLSVITDNVGYGLTEQLVASLESTVDEATKEQQLRGAFLAPSESFFVPPDRVLEMFTTDLPIEERPQPGHKYVIFWDPSIASDPTAVIVLDVTTKPWRGVYFRHWPRPMSVTELVNAMLGLHYLYNGATDDRGLLPGSKAITGFDGTSMGGQIIAQMMKGLRPHRSVNFGGPEKKLKVLAQARAAMTKIDPGTGFHEMYLPDQWTRVRQEVMSYRLKDEKLKNDCVMALSGAVLLAATGFTGEATVSANLHARRSPMPLYR